MAESKSRRTSDLVCHRGGRIGGWSEMRLPWTECCCWSCSSTILSSSCPCFFILSANSNPFPCINVPEALLEATNLFSLVCELSPFSLRASNPTSSACPLLLKFRLGLEDPKAEPKISENLLLLIGELKARSRGDWSTVEVVVEAEVEVLVEFELRVRLMEPLIRLFENDSFDLKSKINSGRLD